MLIIIYSYTIIMFSLRKLYKMCYLFIKQNSLENNKFDNILFERRKSLFHHVNLFSKVLKLAH